MAQFRKLFIQQGDNIMDGINDTNANVQSAVAELTLQMSRMQNEIHDLTSTVNAQANRIEELERNQS